MEYHHNCIFEIFISSANITRSLLGSKDLLIPDEHSYVFEGLYKNEDKQTRIIFFYSQNDIAEKMEEIEEELLST